MKKIDCVLQKGLVKTNIVLENTTPINYIEKKELLDQAIALDKIDSFDELIISPNEYKAKEYKMLNGNYQLVGIPYDRQLHKSRNNPIYNHQQIAVKKFFRDFRGIGILADEVGMGKTIEAGMILSELAQRKLIASVLVVASSKENLENWVLELTDKFGLFMRDDNKEPIYFEAQDENDILDFCEDNIPNRPIIMDMKSFVNMNVSKIKNVVFDLIIVDEAHNLSDFDDSKQGMENLNVLMKVKKQNNKPYCILLSGTPHNGNLDTMFPLWYFMKGDSFESYEKAYNHYKNYLCYNTSTMTEYIEYFREKHLKNNSRYLSFKQEYLNNLFPNLEDRKRKENVSNNDISIRNEFLARFENEDILNIIKEDTKNSYNGLINSFMIRNHRALISVGNQRNAYNYYFLPLYDSNLLDTTITVGETDFYTNRAKHKIKLVDIDFTSKCISYNNEILTIKDFLIKTLRKDRQSNKQLESEKNKIIFSFLREANAFKKGNIGTSEQYIIDEDYYYNSFFMYDKQIENNIIPVLSSSMVFEEKCKKFISICNSENDKQIIVFFDYANTSDLDEMSNLIDYLANNDKELYKRIIVDNGDGEEAALFVEKNDGILFASYSLSQSSNFQFCYTIINFSISKSPIVMDQKIGRIDRIGQENNMKIYTLARMDHLDGYISALFNNIKLFSGWKDDIILVTGCDNKNTTLKICDDCYSVIRDAKGDMHICEKCGGILKNIEVHDDYRCSNDECSYTFLRKNIVDENNQMNKSLGYSYTCPKNVKLDLVQMNNKEYYVCPKTCVIENCQRQNKHDCEIINNGSLYPSLMKKMTACQKCDNQFCTHCNIKYDSLGCDYTGNKVFSGCASCPSRPKCFFIFDKTNPVCPVCNSKLEAMVPQSFEEFALYIWPTLHFVDDFLIETKKILNVVRTLQEGGDNNE